MPIFFFRVNTNNTYTLSFFSLKNKNFEFDQKKKKLFTQIPIFLIGKISARVGVAQLQFGV